MPTAAPEPPPSRLLPDRDGSEAVPGRVELWGGGPPLDSCVAVGVGRPPMGTPTWAGPPWRPRL